MRILSWGLLSATIGVVIRALERQLGILGSFLGFLGGLVFAAIGSYARALIYRYSTGRPVPGIDPVLFTGVFQAKKGRRRFA